MLRLLAGDVALCADFDVDTIADIRLATDEVCTSLADAASGGTSIRCRLQVLDSREFVLAAEASTTTADGVRTDTFSWQVLSAMVDALWTDVRTEGDEYVARVELSKSSAVPA
ncbi:ATP-binding protein [Salinifilum ghardaiensis]